MGWLGSLFGTDKAVNNIIDKDNGLLAQLGTGIGNLHYSEQEKANMRVTIMGAGIARLKALEPFKVVQRILAFMATFLWVFVGINVVAAIWVQAMYPEIDAKADLLTFAMSDYVFWPVVTVYALYFSGGVIESIKGKLSK